MFSFYLVGICQHGEFLVLNSSSYVIPDYDYFLAGTPLTYTCIDSSHRL